MGRILTAGEYLSRYPAIEVVQATNDLVESSPAPEAFAAYVEAIETPQADRTAAEQQTVDTAGENILGVYAALGEAIGDAEDEALSYVMARFPGSVALTPATAGPILVRRVAEMARFFLRKRRPTEEIRTVYEDARKWLELVAVGRASIGLTPGKDEGEKPISGVAVSAPDEAISRVFGDGEQDRYINGYI